MWHSYSNLIIWTNIESCYFTHVNTCWLKIIWNILESYKTEYKKNLQKQTYISVYEISVAFDCKKSSQVLIREHHNPNSIDHPLLFIHTYLSSTLLYLQLHQKE